MDIKIGVKRPWRWLIAMLVILLVGGLTLWASRKLNINPAYAVGQPLDSLHGVVVYYNGGVGNVSERNLTTDDYNLGLKYQCVEFVKRYYYEHLNHRMPDSYGHAKDFFDTQLSDGQVNEQRNLRQYANPSQTRPLPGDLLVFSPTIFNPYGHVAIVADVSRSAVEIIQQNPGPFGQSRAQFSLQLQGNTWYIANERIVGWLRKE